MTTVLNVDDNSANLYVKSRALRAAGFEVLEASTGEKALSLAADRHPDLVLLDIRLPDISGIEVCRRLRADSTTQRIPIVHISATHITAADEASSLDAGADIYLAEPVGPKELSAAVRTLLRLRSSEQGLAGALQQAQEAQRVAEQALRMKDEFLAILSHELRTPMSAMLGWLHLLKVGKLTPEQQGNALETIERNARIQTQLVNDLLDVSRIVTGKMELDPEVMPLDRALESAIDSARLEGDARRIELKAHLGRGAWHVKGNPGRVQQIFSNLLSNALKFSPEGSRVEIRLERAGGAAKVSVIDRGEGISADVLPHVFERFRQADSSTRRRHGGLGLGLAIVRSLVELHGGSVAAASPGPGLGATFTVTLPLVAMPAKQAGSDADQSHEADLTGIRVLVVDDDQSNLQMIAQLLRMHGASVMSASDARGTLAIAEGWGPDALILDIGLPDKDGYQLLRELRTALGRDGDSLPAVALTGFASEEDSRRALEAGFQAHVAKPFDMTGLCQLLAQLTRRSVQLRQ
jgi:signal transduction histidine kinase